MIYPRAAVFNNRVNSIKGGKRVQTARPNRTLAKFARKKFALTGLEGEQLGYCESERKLWKSFSKKPE